MKRDYQTKEFRGARRFHIDTWRNLPDAIDSAKAAVPDVDRVMILDVTDQAITDPDRLVWDSATATPEGGQS